MPILPSLQQPPISVPYDIVRLASRHRVTVPAFYTAYAKNIRAVGSVVGVLDDDRANSTDGQVFVPGVAGEGILTGDVTAFNAAAAVTVMAEMCQQPGSAQAGSVLTRMTGATATTEQLRIVAEMTSTRMQVLIGDGVATRSNVNSATGSILAGVRYKVFVRYDGSAGTDETKVTFWISTFNPLTQAWSVVVQSATTVVTPGVPAALISITSNVGIGRRPDSTASTLFGVLGGGSEESTRVWIGDALTEAEMNAEVASATPVIAANLSYSFSGATPYANLGSEGAVGDGTAGSNTVLCSGDRRYCGIASAGTSRPTISTLPNRIVADGVNDYLRNIWVGQLESITGAAALVVVGTTPTANSDRSTADLSVGSLRALQVRALTGLRQARTSDAALDGPNIAAQSPAVRVLVGSRTAAGAGVTGYRDGTNAQITASETPVSASATNRLTLFGNRSDTVATFADGDARAVLIVAGTAANIAAFVASAEAAYWGRTYHGASI